MTSGQPTGEWRRGWRIVAGAAVGMGTGISLYLLVMSLFVVHLAQDHGWTRGSMGVAGMLAFVTGAVTMPFIGRLVDRIGFRRVVLVCAPGLATVYLLIALQPGSYAVHLLLAICGGLFGGGTGALAYTRPLVMAFERQRGLALGVATAGTSIVAMIVPPVLAAAIAAYGWRAGFYALAAVTALVGLPIALATIGRAREQGTRPAVAAGARCAATGAAVSHVTLREAMRGPRFWLLAGALAAVNIPGSGVVGQLAPLIGDKGLAPPAVALVMSIYALGLLAGRLVTGFSLDRLPAPLVGAVMTLIPALGVVLLLAPSASFALAAVAVGLIGLQQGSEIDLLAYFVSHGFGQQHYASIYGAVGVAGALSTAFALVFFGRVHDLTGSYDLALRVGAIAFCLGAAAFGALGLVGDAQSRPAAAAYQISSLPVLSPNRS